MQLETPETKITTTDNGITTEGIYYNYQNGYMNKQSGRHFINKKDLLLVNVVRDRSKKMMFAFVLIGLAFIWLYNKLLSSVKDFFTIESIFDIQDRIEQAQEIVEKANSPLFYLVMSIIIIGIITAYCFLLHYAFSNRKYIEITYIGGCIRVRCKGVPSEQINSFIQNTNNRE